MSVSSGGRRDAHQVANVTLRGGFEGSPQREPLGAPRSFHQDVPESTLRTCKTEGSHPLASEQSLNAWLWCTSQMCIFLLALDWAENNTAFTDSSEEQWMQTRPCPVRLAGKGPKTWKNHQSPRWEQGQTQAPPLPSFKVDVPFPCPLGF